MSADTSPDTGADEARYPSLRDRPVLVTGGAAGIGEAIVEQFVRQGARVAFVDLAEDARHALVDTAGGRGRPSRTSVPATCATSPPCSGRGDAAPPLGRGDACWSTTPPMTSATTGQT